MIKPVRDLIDEEVGFYGRRRIIEARTEVPDTKYIPIEDPIKWLRIHDVVCVFVDMQGSTRLSATQHDNGTAGVYRLFTSTAIRIFHHYDAPYIDVKGDGVFALFNKNQVYRALVAAVDFKTFSAKEFVPRVKEKTGLVIGTHIGIAQRTVIVRKLGFKRHDGRTDRQNEVWAGKPVNMAAKLAAATTDGQLMVAEHYYRKLRDKRATHSCGCPDQNKVPLWTEVNLSADDRFDFDKGYRLDTCWCTKHGKEFSEGLIAADG